MNRFKGEELQKAIFTPQRREHSVATHDSGFPLSQQEQERRRQILDFASRGFTIQEICSRVGRNLSAAYVEHVLEEDK